MSLAQVPSFGEVEAFTEPVAEVVWLGPGHWWIDFGTAAFANLRVDVPETAADGTRMTVSLGEARRGDALAVEPEPGGTVRYQQHDLALVPGKTVQPALTWAPPGWMKEGWLELPEGAGQMMPFRYVELTGAPAWLDPQAQVSRIGWRAPFDDAAAEFHSSSAELNAVWALCKYSIKATTFMGLYVDGDRERKPYEADALINQWSHYAVDAHYETARATNDYLIEHPTWPTEWRLQTALLVWLDYLWSGDDASLKKHYDKVVERTMIERRTEDGLFIGFEGYPNRDIIDWPGEERDGYDMAPDVKTVVTAFHFRALQLLEKMAAHLGRTDEAARFGALAQQTFATVNARLWDEARGCYRDGLDSATGEVSEHAASHATFFALALGLVPPERVERATAWIAERGMVCSVYGSQFLLEALYRGGAAETGLALLTDRGPRSWLNMSEQVGSTITLEAWDPIFKPNLDWNHAWGAAPANAIPRFLMGLEPLEPGFARFAVRPQTASLEHARVKLPTPRGPIELAVAGTTPETWSARLVVPAGTVAEFQLPFAGEPIIADGPVTAEVLEPVNGQAVLALPAGTWELRLMP